MGLRNGFQPLRTEMVTEKEGMEGLSMPEYPTWSELAHVQPALEPTVNMDS